MAARKKSQATDATNKVTLATAGVREALGYLNFSDGREDPTFLKHLNEIWRQLPKRRQSPEEMAQVLLTNLDELQKSEAAFAEISQARRVIELTIDQLLPAYKQFHQNLLFHLSEDDYAHPFLFGVLLQAVLRQGPADDQQQIISGALQSVNDFVGYRPVAVLENGRRMEVYPHERHRPVPLYLPDAGVAVGPYEELITQTIEFLKSAPQELLHESHFDLAQLDELACDMRAYDHLHPVYKRTNYMFGEWDPHQIDNKGNYRRFVIRKIVLDALLDWIHGKSSRAPKSEKLFDAAAALCGTMLMASSISGSGPNTHDSTTSLTVLLPIVARRRDEFYERVMSATSGARARRLQEEAAKAQQPFGHIRQFLNMKLAGYGARQVQHRALAHLYAMMGYEEASRAQANSIPASSIRIETEIECRLAAIHRELDREHVESAVTILKQIPQLITDGIECGAIVDPWNILGFHGHFPLFAAREDAIPDSRVEVLLGMMESVFAAFSRTLGEAGAIGDERLNQEIFVIYQGLADWWDRFGSDVIEELPDVDGQESCEAAAHVSEAMNEWRQAGAAAGDVTFWRDRVHKFQSAQSYALVVDALLQKKDDVASMGLLMQWLSQLNDVGYECPQHSIFSLLIRWMKLRTRERNEGETFAEQATAIRRLFAFLEANAEDWWTVPLVGHNIPGQDEISTTDLLFGEPPMDEEDPDPDDEDNLFSAAYDDMVFRDTADDGNWGDTVDDGISTGGGEFETLNRELEPRIKFLNSVGQLWQLAAAAFAKELQHDPTAEEFLKEQLIDSIVAWHRQAQRWQIDLAEMMENIWDREISEPFGDHDGNVEYDLQLQVKFYLLHQVIQTLICLQNSERLLNGLIPGDISIPRGTEQDQRLTKVFRAVVQRDRKGVRQNLPGLISRLQRSPLLYVPFESGGDPSQILRAQALQSVIRFLLRELPKLGMLRETWHLLYAAFRMERRWKPRGQAITEFDRLFAIALRNTLEAVVQSVPTWSTKGDPTEDLIEAIGKVLDPYQWLWSEHSRTMRISAVDAVRDEGEWEDMFRFIRNYGGDLFHASQLTLGNVRAIMHHGVDWFLDYLQDEQDPLAPSRLIRDLDSGVLDRDDAEWALDLIYSMIVDRFDRFLEYNTTTTQSDYGELLYCLLDFLRLEARYDRDAWNLTPLIQVHEVLVRHNLLDAADVWESTFEMQTDDLAAKHLKNLKRLQAKYGIQMPTITDHLREKFVKPLAVNRMVALVKQATDDARKDTQPSQAFEMLYEEIEDYLNDSWGSGIDVPDWLRAIEQEVRDTFLDETSGFSGIEADIDTLPQTLTRAEFNQQVQKWKEGLGKRSRKKSQRERRDRDPEFPEDTGGNE